MTNDRILSRLLKVKALSERGIGGERANATKLLSALKKKYQIKRITPELKEREFACQDKYEEDLLCQSVWHWFDGKVTPYTCDGNVLVTINDKDYICFSEFISFHKAQFNRNKNKLLNRYTNAYIKKYDLYTTDTVTKPVSHKVYQELDLMCGFISGKKFSKKQKQLKGIKI